MTRRIDIEGYNGKYYITDEGEVFRRNMTPKEYLSRYKYIETEIELLKENLTRLRSLSTKTGGSVASSASKGTHKTNSAKHEYTLDRIMAIDSQLDTKINQLLDTRNEISCLIDNVKDNTLRLLLQMKYINGYSLELIAEKLNYSYIHIVKNLHPKALKEVKKIRRT